MGDTGVVDIHVHVGLVGDRWPKWGKLSEWYRQQLNFKIFLLYARIPADQVSDTVLRESTIRTISSSRLDGVVCLALDPVYDTAGRRQESASHIWVDNEYVLDLQKDAPKALFGASVHPYDPAFQERVAECVRRNAVLLKWVPSGQQINLADARVGEAMKFLATAKGGKPLPLLLHVGPEYAVPTSDARTFTNDFLSWSWWERTANRFRGGNRWNTPDVDGIRRNITGALDVGAVIIFAHCGLPYFGAGLFSLFEHSDFTTVRDYVTRYAAGTSPGRCYADVSAFCTPVRLKYFGEVQSLPPGFVLFGSDFPTPIFELFTTAKERDADFKAVLEGHLERLIVPEDNLLDVNHRQLRQAFPGHPMFTNFSKLM